MLSGWWPLPYRIPCFDKASFEPYLIVPTPTLRTAAPGGADGPSTTPWFDERYVGYGKNKVSWVQALRASGHTFWVLPRGFLAHFPHDMSRSGRQWQRNRGGHKAQMDALFDAQLAEAERRELAGTAAAADDRADADRRGGASCAPRTAAACRVPLVQFIDPLNPTHASRREAVARILA